MLYRVATGEGAGAFDNGATFWNGMNSVVSATASSDNQVIYYDHWEDGYEADLLNPVQPTHDGDRRRQRGQRPGLRLHHRPADPALWRGHRGHPLPGLLRQLQLRPGPPRRHPQPQPGRVLPGRPPGAAVGPALLGAGEPPEPRGHPLRRRRPDHEPAAARCRSSTPWTRCRPTSAGPRRSSRGRRWPPPGPTPSRWARTATCGDNTVTEPFKYVDLDLVAFEDGTRCSSTAPGAGTVSFTLNQGEHYSSRGLIDDTTAAPAITINEGTKVSTTGPIAGMIFTGGDGTFAVRMYTLLPDLLHSTDYVITAPGDDPGPAGQPPPQPLHPQPGPPDRHHRHRHRLGGHWRPSTSRPTRWSTTSRESAGSSPTAPRSG